MGEGLMKHCRVCALMGSAAGEVDPETGQPSTEPEMPDEDETNENSDGDGQGGNNTDSPATDGEDFQTDPSNPPPNTDTSSDAFGGNWASGGASTFVDCEDGTCIELVEVGGYVPPVGWDDADRPPPDPDWEIGTYWDGFYRGDPYYGATAYEVMNKIRAAAVAHRNQCLNLEVISASHDVYMARLVRCTDGGGVVNFSAVRRQCSSSYIEQYCTIIEAPARDEFWPSDNCIQLAPNSEGNWAASSRDPDVTAKYSEPKSTLELCTPSGETVDIYKRVGGGHVYFNQTQGIWAGSDSSGRVRSFGSTSTLNQEIARPRN